MNNYYLGREEAYIASPQVWSFRNVDDIVNGINLRLSNMAGGFPFECGGRVWKDSERLYLCGEWSNNTDEHRFIQECLLSYTSGFGAKRFGKSRFKNIIRPDFSDFRLQWMLYCVWQKCKGNEDFRKLLLQISQNVILVENTTTDKWSSADIWGCKNWELVNKRANLATVLMERHQDLKRKERDYIINVETNKINDIGVWKGQNNIGKILMLWRDCIREGKEPQIDYDLLRRSNIYILGQLYTFNQ
ncbi:MAG: NADAR family protein [Muribaculaceae bacterium]|nr:NADAR family protein [Muribaculaceae bacterium]